MSENGRTKILFIRIDDWSITSGIFGCGNFGQEDDGSPHCENPTVDGVRRVYWQEGPEAVARGLVKAFISDHDVVIVDADEFTPKVASAILTHYGETKKP